MDGGAGNDVIDAVFSGPANEPLLADVVLLGGAGNDAFRLLWDDKSWLALAFVDGGAGVDRGVFSPGVEHEKVEKVR